VLRIGGTWRVPTAGVLAVLGLAVSGGAGQDGLAEPEPAVPESLAVAGRTAAVRPAVGVRRAG